MVDSIMAMGIYSRHCEERLRRSNPVFLSAVGWIASLHSQ
jgi:hypothetical protein